MYQAQLDLELQVLKDKMVYQWVSARAGFQAGADLSGVNLIKADAIVKTMLMTVTYEGFRASLKHEINDNWDALVSFLTSIN